METPTASTSQPAPPVGPPLRLLTGITGLDEVLDGGLLRGDSYLVEGPPGSGKTILGNHLAYNHARSGGVALYVTTMAETHALMVAHLRSFEFFDPNLVAQRLHYLSIYAELTKGGLPDALDVLRRLVREYRATLLVVDSVDLIIDLAATRQDARYFFYELHAQLALLGCTTVLLAEPDSQRAPAMEAIVDGLIFLEDEATGLRNSRFIQVRKQRGANHLRGRHEFSITHEGIEVYPRLEAIASAMPPNEDRQRVAFGVRELDDMLRGGVFASSATLLLGGPGSGKTTLGVHFVVEGARRGERGLIYTLHDSPARLIGLADSFGLDLSRHVHEQRVRLMWHSPIEPIVDAIAHELLEAVAEFRPRRLFIDGMSTLERVALSPERLPAFFGALVRQSTVQQVTVLLGAETNVVVGASLEIEVPVVSAVVDNVIILRYVELLSQLHRLISVLKVHGSDHDTAIREFFITSRGIRVAETFESAEAVLTGVARQIVLPRPGGGRRPRAPKS